MNILVIGNGFDLAHNLPTKYSDFLAYIKEKKYLEITNSNTRDEFISLIANNFWVMYFIDIINDKKTWVDFEAEIAKMIKSLDYLRKHLIVKSSIEHRHNFDEQRINVEISGVIADDMFNKLHKIWHINYNSIGELEDEIYDSTIVQSLFDKLNNLIRALEIYLDYHVNKKEITVISKDISEMQVNKIISFNYTNTYERVYNVDRERIQCDYIHGTANANRCAENNNMVLGIDEYLDKDARNKEIRFIGFKKFFQRIHKETGCEYKNWIKELNGPQIRTLDTNSKAERDQVYIFGHSLDITDGDILSDLILSKGVVTTIFYLNKQVYAQQIANLVRVIGQDELIKRVSEPNKTIIFKKQRDMLQIV